jgi:hypothetical protein
MNMDSSSLTNWITLSKEYIAAINKDFIKKCDIKLERIKNIEEHKQRSKVFNMENINRLPEDIIRHIYQYLMPETRIKLVRARYPNLDTNIMKLKVSDLKKLSKNISINYYQTTIDNMHRNGTVKCLPKNFYLRFTFTNKKTCIDNLNKLIGTYENAVAHTPYDYRYFQKKTLRILKSLVYICKQKGVLDNPYAPELEIPKTIKKPRKKRLPKVLH